MSLSRSFTRNARLFRCVQPLARFLFPNFSPRVPLAYTKGSRASVSFRVSDRESTSREYLMSSKHLAEGTRKVPGKRSARRQRVRFHGLPANTDYPVPITYARVPSNFIVRRMSSFAAPIRVHQSFSLIPYWLKPLSARGAKWPPFKFPRPRSDF